MKGFFGLEERESEAEMKRHIASRLATLALDAAAVAPYLYHLLALSVEDEVLPHLTSELLRQRTVEALNVLVLAAARRQPLVLILEDVHWIDKATEEVLAALVEVMATVPLLLVLVYRPEYLHAWAHKAYHTQVALTRLPSASSVEMVRAILTKPYAARIALERLSPEHGHGAGVVGEHYPASGTGAVHCHKDGRQPVVYRGTHPLAAGER
jgi:predicted ATPase